MKKEKTWTWPIGSYLFLGGLGGGMMAISAVADLFFDMGNAFALGTLAAAIIIGIGSGLLVFDLGRPFYFWRVFSREKAILTVGAWVLTLAIVCGLIYGSLLLVFSPWHSFEGLRLVFAWICLLLGVGVAIYTGIFLGTIKARPFWNSPALPILFLISAVSTGLAGQSLLIHFWALGATESQVTTIASFLHLSDIGLLVLEIIVLMVYVLIMRYSTTVPSAQIATSWVSGSKKLQFWGGLVFLGLILPIVFYLVPGSVTYLLAAALVLVGGIILRFLVVYTDDRVLLPGEEQFLFWLPSGDEEFLHAWEE
ncbi:NrfD/PsrC family molybdoenzyme membrane anchor subunit [Chloroflexota bacterium]